MSDGGLRAAEDLALWAACEDGDRVVLDCGEEGAPEGEGRRLLDPSDHEERSPTAGETLEHGVAYFTLSNPDGWVRGDYSEGGVFYQRYNGHGMDPAVHGHVFEQSFTTKPAGKGRGIGLYLCKTLIEEARGHIDLQSTQGVGTTVRVSLPSQLE